MAHELAGESDESNRAADSNGIRAELADSDLA